ncbi:MAG: flavin reductase family protein [Hyphomicrobiales bacterium]
MNPDISEMIHHPDTRDTSPAIVDLRAAMAPVPTSVAIATARDETGRMAGITLSSLTSVSLEPPLLLWCLRATSHSRPVFDRSSHFALNLLSDDQTELCERFGRPFAGDRFAGID